MIFWCIVNHGFYQQNNLFPKVLTCAYVRNIKHVIHCHNGRMVRGCQGSWIILCCSWWLCERRTWYLWIIWISIMSGIHQKKQRQLNNCIIVLMLKNGQCVGASMLPRNNSSVHPNMIFTIRTQYWLPFFYVNCRNTVDLHNWYWCSMCEVS